MSAQRGFALIALLSLAALISAFLIASALNLTGAGISKEREERSMNALRQARAALIAYAASEQWQKYMGEVTMQPGALPCPDILHGPLLPDGTDPDEGDSDCVFPLTSSLIGRLPFKTLGINDLRDASGEQLWYALSANFRKASGTTIINSDTQACDTPACNPGESHLTVAGTAPANNVVAVLFAPGEALLGQTRSSNPMDPAHNNPASYLENFTLGDGIHFTFTTTALPSGTFNDRVLVITQAELMAAVEPVVAARIEREIKPLLQDYFNKWGAYPFPVPFGGGGPPIAQSSYLGVSTPTPHGLLPLTNVPTTFAWTGAAVTQLVGHPMETGNSNVTSSICTINSSPRQALCQVNYSGGGDDRPVIVLEVFLSNANILFADVPSGTTAPNGITMVDNDGDSLAPGPYGQWSSVLPDFPPTRTFVARAAGGALTYTGRLRPAGSTEGRVTITVPLPPPAVLNFLLIISDNPGPPVGPPADANPNGAWFIANQWYKQTYYAVSPGYAPGGVAVGSSAACSPLPATPSCLKVNNLLPAPSNNKGAILVLAGRSLNGSPRPPGIANYLESANLTAANDTTPFVYEHRAGVPTAINDRVVVVSP